LYPIAEIAEAVAVAHDGGARVAAHVSSPYLAELIDVGIDSIEHGPLMTPELVDAMAERGTAWVPTLSTVFVKHLDPLTSGDTPVARYLKVVYANMEASLARAVERGVPILAGTDERPHGAIALEVEQLRRFGLSAENALAAATVWPRRYFGLPVIEEGAPADLVLFERDPRTDPTTTARTIGTVMDGAPTVT
jgi:imidazolonepropionase-like amidohydrolase